jgi:ParB family chromosome partitioning protein
MLTEIDVDLIDPNPDQPRKHFDEGALQELAASIKQNGLLQPITVQPRAGGRFMIVAGERRWRAHRLLGAAKVRAIVQDLDDRERDIAAIIENLQREDISQLEEGRAYQRMLDAGFTVDELATRLGLKQSWRITERTSLLRLRPEHQRLVEQGHLTPSQAFEMSRLEPADQDRLLRMIRDGKADSYTKLRAAADTMLGAASQGALWDLPKPSEAEQRLLSDFERKLEQIVRLIGAGFNDGEIVVLKKINPHRAAEIVTELALVKKHVTMLERELQRAATQAELLA